LGLRPALDISSNWEANPAGLDQLSVFYNCIRSKSPPAFKRSTWHLPNYEQLKNTGTVYAATEEGFDESSGDDEEAG
jgi:hypothetical protein